MQYFRIGPTPCVMTSQPASVSTGEPQFPIFTISHGWAGWRSKMGLLQKCGLSDDIRKRFSSSCRESMT